MSVNHLFKLKKDGKTVAYCKWTEDMGWIYSLTVDFKDTFTHFAVSQTKTITAHPFVTKDKNGKDVFAGDEIKGTVETILQTENVAGWVEWFEADKRYDLLTKEGSVSIALSEIELIEIPKNV